MGKLENIERSRKYLSDVSANERKLRILEAQDRKRRKKEAHERLLANAEEILKQLRKEKGQ